MQRHGEAARSHRPSPLAVYTCAPDGFAAMVAAAEDERLACADDGPP
ncbi:MAG: hypothetical protein JNL82_35555 [Myxococcales bacterium]|nr:hypothetical protein [Myxococcales bacterium]